LRLETTATDSHEVAERRQIVAAELQVEGFGHGKLTLFSTFESRRPKLLVGLR